MEFRTTARSKNKKTGDVPTIYVGGSREESIDSCRQVKCPLLHHKHGGLGGVVDEETGLKSPICYAQHGSPSFGFMSLLRKKIGSSRVDFINALSKRSISAKIIRLSALGDPSTLSLKDLQFIFNEAEKFLLKVIGYTHGWREWQDNPSVNYLRGRVMASCDTLVEADEAIFDGWQAAVTLPHTTQPGDRILTPAGHKVIICPAMSLQVRLERLQKKHAAIGLTPEEHISLQSIRVPTCNDCRLCSGDRPGIVIGFPLHDITHGKRNIWR